MPEIVRYCLPVDPPKPRTWIDDGLQAIPEDKAQLHEALDAWERITESGRVEPADLDALVAAAAHRHTAVWSTGVSLLMNLVVDFPEMKAAAWNIMRTEKAAQRWHLIQGF